MGSSDKHRLAPRFVGVLEQDYRPPEAPNLLKDFFGDYRDPLWDDIENVKRAQGGAGCIEKIMARGYYLFSNPRNCS